MGGFPVLVMSFNYRQIGPDEGLTFKQLVRDLRFEMSCDMLAASNAPMAQIAEMLGYSDQTVFSAPFHVTSGTRRANCGSPSDERRRRTDHYRYCKLHVFAAKNIIISFQL